MTARSAPFGLNAFASAPSAEQAHSDEALVNRIVGGDKGAMRILFGRHNVRVYRFTLKLVRDEALAEDLTNQVFLEVWRHVSRFEGRSAVSTWLLAIARHTAVSALRKRKEMQLDDGVTSDVADLADDPEAALDRLQTTSLIRQCLDRLSRDHAQIIDLVYYHERSVSEVAKILGIPQATVKTRMFYARKKLGELLEAA